MKYEYINQVDERVNCYGYMVKTGDVVEMEGHFSSKAKRNPDWKPAQENAKVTVERSIMPTAEALETAEQTNQGLRTENDELKAKNKQLEQQNRNLKNKK